MELETAGEIWCEALHAHRLNSIWGFWGNCQHFEKQVLRASELGVAYAWARRRAPRTIIGRDKEEAIAKVVQLGMPIMLKTYFEEQTRES